MKLCALFLIAAASLRADFSYQETVQVTGGDSVTVTHLLKGNRRADLTKGHVTVFDLDRATVTEIDLSKKTYSVISFDDLKKSVKVAGDFGAETKGTGQTKSVGVLNSKEAVLTLTSAEAQVVVDAWSAVFPGYGDVTQFNRTLGEKLAFLFSTAVWRLVRDRPDAAPGLEAAAREMNKLTGVPLEYVTRIGKLGDSPQAAPAEQGGIAGALGRLRPGHKDDPVNTAATASASVIEVRTRLENFSSGPTDGSKFDVPAGFKNVDPAPAK